MVQFNSTAQRLIELIGAVSPAIFYINYINFNSRLFVCFGSTQTHIEFWLFLKLQLKAVQWKITHKHGPQIE